MMGGIALQKAALINFTPTVSCVLARWLTSHQITQVLQMKWIYEKAFSPLFDCCGVRGPRGAENTHPVEISE